MRRATRGVIALAVALLVAPCVAQAQSPPVFLDHGVRLSIVTRSADTLQRVTALWGAATDGRFSADTFRVTARVVGGQRPWSLSRTLITQSTGFTIPLPINPSDSVGVLITVRASRRGVASEDSVYGTRWFKRNWTGPLPLEMAMLDSFPKANRAIAVYPWKFKLSQVELDSMRQLSLAQATTAEARDSVHQIWDSIMMEPDSLPEPQPRIGDWTASSIATIGHGYQLCVLGVNRYTDQYVVFSDTPQLAGSRCSTLLPVWRQQREGAPPTPPGALDLDSPLLDPVTQQLRAGILAVDSSQFSGVVVDRVDPAGRTPFRVRVHRVYGNAATDSAYAVGAVVTAPHRCPRKADDPWAGGMWDIRWNPAVFPVGNDAGANSNLFRVAGDPNTVYPYRAALAMAAQLPTDSLATLSRESYAAYVRADTSWTNGKVWYEECFGPLAPTP